MGSLVISQVAPGLGQHPYHHMMVDTNPHHEDSDRGYSASASSDQTPVIHEPSEDSSTPGSQHDDHEPGSAHSSSPHHQHSSYYPQNVNQHSRGFDQSGFPLTSDPRVVVANSPPSPRLQPTYRSTRSLGASEASSPSRIKVRDLSHIRSLASEEYLNRPRLSGRSASSYSDTGRQYEISAMPVTDIIEMVAGLLTKITTTNDRQHEHHRPIPLTEEQSHLNPHASCVLAFHGKNVPGITILSYLSRIHKYCPTTYEVFLSLLVYFDRMTEMVNRGLLGNVNRRPDDSPATAPESSTPTPRSPVPMNVDSPQEHHDISTPPSPSDSRQQSLHQHPSSPQTSSAPTDLSQFFVVDSYNIHRLVIAGVTCASKFFSDVFYTNSRYAKVGGLPLAELNNLELQFLLLNDFRLSVPVEELEAYGTMLVEFYARELLAQQQLAQQQQQQHHQSGTAGPSPPTGAGDGMYMRSPGAEVGSSSTQE
ncbi:uncharacterized protein Z520_10509 [Fonsecaea multimorphosa CBS 102226]|uniref:Cyclin n=1 Tax=Fonsecaea multimorphosa CBS 102226 TaxID=1442371 RepID=A0A0D2JTU1_9EURO|nr:uncharacterized protein Z520_10509 [Fonsecaea multimorphosa CBS 102226]KIX93884.1 hypothetical protein Z520_10509 [Fonsecaea multimorphosa CBS 102226]OAL19121.1 hypothetical protein AYO22_10069 [Fonsecaea multimorphosa]